MSSIVKTPSTSDQRPLDPRIVDALRRFLRRTNFADAMRGVCLVVLAFLLCFGIVAALDYFWFIEESTRLYAAIAAYLATLAIALGWVLRPAVRKASLEQLAKQFEKAEPKLRNHLLSAVELGDGDWDEESASAGSSQFRQLLQRRVANFIAGIQVRRLVPLRIIQPWLNVAAAAVLLLVVCMLIPGSPLALLYARAVAPMANLARASSTKITVIIPDFRQNPGGIQVVPAGETLLVEALIEGSNIDEAWLESKTVGSSNQLLDMRVSQNSSQIFYCNLEVSDVRTQFRITAGDAITAWFTLEPKQRPEMLNLQATIQYPGYAKLEPLVLKSDVDAISVLNGSDVSIAATLNQPVSKADVQLLDGNELGSDNDAPSIEPLERKTLEQVAYNFGPIFQPISYRLLFKSSETGFDNAFPATRSINIIDDSPPIARLGLTSGAMSITAPPRDLLSAAAEVRDEIPVDSMVLEYSVNERPWTAFPQGLKLDIDDQRSSLNQLRMIYSASSELDLANVSLSEGDLLRFRLQAVDRRNQMTYSDEIEVLITGDFFTAERYRYVQQRLAWLGMILDWSSAEPPQSTATDVIEAGKQLLDATPSGIDALEVELLSRAILSAEQLAATRPDRSENEKRRIKNAATWFVAFNINEVVARDFQALYASASRILELADANSDSWNLRQLEILAANYKSCIDQYRVFQEMLPDSAKRSLRGIVEQLDQYLTRIESVSLDQSDRRRVLEEQRFQQQQLAYRYDNPLLDGSISSNSMDGLRALFQIRTSHGKLIDKLAELLKEQSEFKAKQAKLTDARESGEIQQKLQERNDEFKRVITELDGQLTTLHSVHSGRKDVNPTRQSDLDLVQRAISAVLSQKVSGVDPQTAFKEIGKATGVLDVGQDVFEFEAVLRQLAIDERWNGDRLVLRLENPRRWDYWGRGVEMFVQELRSTELPREISDTFDRMRYEDPAGNVGRLIGNRRWDKAWTSTASDDLDSILAKYVEHKAEVDTAMQEARETLRKYLPQPERSEQQSSEDSNDSQPQLADNDAESALQDLANLPEVELSELLEDAEVMSAEEMLKALEEELKSNSPMQESLSDISDQIVEQAVEQLERAATDEYQSQRELEQNDVAVREEKEMAVRRLQDLAQQIDQVRSNLAQQARSAAGRGAVKEAIDELSEADDLLRKSSDEARKASSAMLSQEIADQSKKAGDLLEQAEQKLNAGKTAAENQTGQELETEPNRKRTRDQMRALDKTMQGNLARAAEQRGRNWQQMERNYQNQANNAQRQKQEAERRLEKAKQSAKEKPSDTGLQQAVTQAQQAVERAQSDLDTFNEMKKQAEDLAKQSQQQANQLKQEKPNELNANNPAAELAKELADQGSQMTSELRDLSQQIAKALGEKPGIEAERNQFAATANQQAQIQKQVNQVADSLERAARHESRLGSESTSARLQQAADEVRQLANGPVEAAKQSAEQVRDQLTESSSRASSQEQGQAAAQSLAEARQAIAQQAEALGAIAAENQAEANAGQQAQGQQAQGQQAQGQQSSSAGSQKVATTMARALDDLDRALFSSAPESQAAQSSAKAMAKSSTLTQAAAEEASSTAQQPSQAEGNPSDQSDSSQQVAGAMSPGGNLDGQASSSPFAGDQAENSILKSMEDWGELRERKAEESTEGRRTAMPRKYQKQIEAYFRSISEKANQ